MISAIFSLFWFHVAITVPLYDTLGPDTVEFVTNECQLNTIVCNANSMENLLKLTKKVPTLKTIIVMRRTMI